ncbi:MAG: universal stress protein [Gammaproteobacteria bacterium]|nr:universal stress protein [Gammaproteobacteria bacterium]MDH4254081.1 universal stress protein [Gammaproteobacteria bacterium]MDH5310477.1 universal stress protein [Gammaproteobacteria bacterium]
MRVILVPVADRPECARALRVAFDLGKRLGATIEGCHIRAHARSPVSLSTEFSAIYYGESSKAANTAWRSKASSKAAVAARRMFADLADANGYEMIRRPRATPGAVWQEKVGAPDKLLRIMGPVSDLLVVSRPSEGGDVARLFMMSALMESGRPVLILPQAGPARIAHRILIAWNQSVEAARAVAESMPLLQQADEVNVVSCGREDRVGPKSMQVVNYLKSWGVKAGHLNTRGIDIERELLETYRKTNSDLVVMGAYSRARWREVAFGGTTRHMLEKAKIPVLMLHT